MSSSFSSSELQRPLSLKMEDDDAGWSSLLEEDADWLFCVLLLEGSCFSRATVQKSVLQVNTKAVQWSVQEISVQQFHCFLDIHFITPHSDCRIAQRAPLTNFCLIYIVSLPLPLYEGLSWTSSSSAPL